MTVVRIDALCDCEGCGKRFGVEVDVATPLKRGDHADFEALVRDTIRGGDATCYTWGVRGQRTVDRMSLAYQVTVQAELMLCDVCSRTCDELPIKGELSRRQVNRALGLPEETT